MDNETKKVCRLLEIIKNRLFKKERVKQNINVSENNQLVRKGVFFKIFISIKEFLE